MGKLQDLDALTTKSHCCPDPTEMFMLFGGGEEREKEQVWPKRGMIQT